MNASALNTFDLDRRKTIENREKLKRNGNLLFWYRRLYRQQFGDLPNFSSMRVLEIGSGTSPAKLFYPHIVTSDVLPLEHVDLVFDCHEIDRLAEIGDASLDVVTLTNVLHHLREPISFLNKVASKIKPGGRVIATEPYFSAMSRLVWRLNPEPIDFSIAEPRLTHIEGPLSTSNQVTAYLIFCKRDDWAARLWDNYESEFEIRFFTSISYMAAGGISRRIPLPHFLYRPLFAADRFLASCFPQIFASYFTITLTRRASGARVG